MAEALAPLRGAEESRPLSGGIASLRSAQPRATFWHRSAMRLRE